MTDATAPPPDLRCHDIVEVVTDYLEGALPAADHAAFEAHLADCPHCTEYLEQMRTSIRVAGRLRADELDPALRARLYDAFRGMPL